MRHWETATKKKGVCAAESRAALHLVISRTLETLLYSEAREKMVLNSLRKSAADIAKEARIVFLATNPAPIELSALLSIGVNVLAAKGQCIRRTPATVTKKMVDSLASDIVGFISMLRGHGIKCKNLAVYTAAILTILKVGYTHRNCTLIPAIPWVAECAPGDMQYRVVSTIGCRAVSIAVRAIKAAMVSGNANALPARRFVFTGAPLV